jgi:AP2 domain
MTGNWPSRFIDHVDGDPINDRWATLRPASDSQNSANSRAKGTSGFKGVTWDKDRRVFAARIKVDYRTINLGRFPTAEEAHAVYAKAAREHFGEFARAH